MMDEKVVSAIGTCTLLKSRVFQDARSEADEEGHGLQCDKSRNLTAQNVFNSTSQPARLEPSATQSLSPTLSVPKHGVGILDLPDELLREASYYMSVRDCCAFALTHARLALLFDDTYWAQRVRLSLIIKDAKYPPLDSVSSAPSSVASSRTSSKNVSRSGSLIDLPDAVDANQTARSASVISSNSVISSTLNSSAAATNAQLTSCLPDNVLNIKNLSWADLCRRIEPQHKWFESFRTAMQCCRITCGHGGDVDKVHFVDDRWLVSGCRDRSVILWDATAIRNLASRDNLRLSVAGSRSVMPNPPPHAALVNSDNSTDRSHDDGIGSTLHADGESHGPIPAFGVPTFDLNSTNAPDDGVLYRRLTHHTGWVWSVSSCDNFVSSGGFDREIHVVDLNSLKSCGGNVGTSMCAKSTYSVPACKLACPSFVYCHLWNKLTNTRASQIVAGCHDNSLRFYDLRANCGSDEPYATDRLGGSGCGTVAVSDDTQVFSVFQDSEHSLVASTRRAFYWFDVRMRRSIAEHIIRYRRSQPDYARAMHFADGVCFIGSIKGQIFATCRELNYEPQLVSTTPPSVPAPLRIISDIHHDMGHVMVVQGEQMLRIYQPTLVPTTMPVMAELSFRRQLNSDPKPLGCTYSMQSGTTAVAANDNTMLLYWPLPAWLNVGAKL